MPLYYYIVITINMIKLKNDQEIFSCPIQINNKNIYFYYIFMSIKNVLN